ncbi:MAG: hypothetical protein NC314_12900 [Roseburia sp.]|nr:hypothetical protein [Ruminococcus sp.]MCM1156328.1 hypothetical protein [Roseburia sp.]MCM1243735.1 hypothetical protein [Roseburia sp.]
MSKTVNKEKRSFISDYQKVMKHLERESFVLPALSVKNAVISVEIPERFSISEQPDKTINLLRWLYTIGKCDNVDRIIFDHSKCEFLGLSASTIMDIILLVAIKYREKIKKPLTLSGNFPRNPMARDVFLASGLPYHISARHKLRYDGPNLEKFETVSGECSNDVRQSGRIATELTAYFNRCLLHQKMKLSDWGISLLVTLLGEVLGNCEIHGGEQATWYTQGHYEDDRNKDYGEMQLLFLNLGNTIYQGLKYNSSKETRERLAYYLERHNSFLSEEWNEEMAYTVFALQEGISRLRDQDIEGYKGRGTGTVTLMETLNLVGRSDDGQIPEMTIVSGRTYIKFDGQYYMKKEKFENDPAFGSGEKRIIAFNKENNIYKPADKEVVRRLKENFPGTVVSLRIYLGNRYIIKEEGDGSDE